MNRNYPDCPLRRDQGTTGLITASSAYPVLEELILSSRSEVLLAFRIFDPQTRLRSGGARSAGLATWAHLIRRQIDEGIVVRLLLADFDSIAGNTLHKINWQSLAGFRAAVSGSSHESNFSSVAALHEAEFGPIARIVFWPLARMRLKRIEPGNAGLKKAERIAEDTPGLRSYFRTAQRWFDGFPLWPPPRMWPATYHQKYAVIDGHHLFIGGLDINERRFDDPDHSRPSDETWHDVSVKADGFIAEDARQFFIQNWNREVPRFNSRLTGLGAPQPDLPATAAPMPAGPRVHRDEPAGTSSETTRFIVTRSRRSRSPFAFGPRPELKQIERAHERMFGRARNLIYLETQFFRSRPLAKQLAGAGKSNPQLRLIILLPAAPDDVAFDANKSADARHGEYLQVRALEIVRQTYGARAAFYCLVKDTPKQERTERDAVDGRAIAYLHSKVAIADSKTAIVSSANLNGRSMRWDTEAGLEWRNALDVSRFQNDIWQAHLRDGFDASATDDPEAAFEMWSDAAHQDEHCRPERPPQIAIYPLESARRFGKRIWYVPDNLV